MLDRGGFLGSIHVAERHEGAPEIVLREGDSPQIACALPGAQGLLEVARRLRYQAGLELEPAEVRKGVAEQEVVVLVARHGDRSVDLVPACVQIANQEPRDSRG